MKQLVKRILYKILGLKLYLRVLYRALAVVIDSGLFKRNETLLLHHFAKKMVQKGDHVMDLGGNLGYYTRVFANTAGKTGKIYVIEPVQPFFKNIAYFLGKRKNLVLYNYALGEEDKEIQLSVPNEYGYLRTGILKVDENNNEDKNLLYFPANMVKGSQLFNPIEKLDYLKVDIEGFERYVIPEIHDFIQRTLPCIQIEISPDDNNVVENELTGMGFEKYFFNSDKIQRKEVHNYKQDFYFIHPSKKNKYNHLIAE